MAEDQSTQKAPRKGRAKIAYQGEPGAYSEIACLEFAPDFEPTPCGTFEEALEATFTGAAERAMLPIENSLAGRVGDLHHLLPRSELHIIAEHFLSIRHQLLGLPDATLDDVKIVRSHAMALGQCGQSLRALGIKTEMAGDTAGAAHRLATSGERTAGAVASRRAAELYGLKILKENIEDAGHNTTRFLQMAREPMDAAQSDGPTVTSFIFQVRNIPAALYKALGGFATNGVNLTKLESYQLDGSFTATMFYADADGHPEDPAMRNALEELSFFSARLRVLGVYRSARQR
ncbi:MAG: prephenate dehydratase [Pseudomonadota bacterium]